MWDQLEQFHLLRPQLLLLIIPLALMVLLIRNRRYKSGLWARVCDEHLLPFLLIGRDGAESPWALIRLLLIGTAIVIAFAGPTWQKLPQPVFRSQAALVIILDLSRSMDVTDIKPSRVTRARHKILDILSKRREGQTALIAYAAEAFVVTPLTEDTNTVASLAKNLSTDLMPYQGSHPEKAIIKAVELFKQASALNGQVLLITDGIDSPDMDDAVSQLTSAGHRLSILGVGTEQGAPIADYRGGFVKSQDGSIVVARLDEQNLKRFAAIGGGIYQKLSANDEDINRLVAQTSGSKLDATVSQEASQLKLQSDQWREEGPWILLLLLPLVALVFRRGFLVILVALLLPLPQPSYAFDWSSLWKNENQRAKSALEQGDNEKAAELFNDPQWKAAANYRAHNYQETVNALESAKTPDALYNRGNALAKLGNLQQAIETYDQVLKINPEHEDAKYNRELLKQYLEKNQNNQNQDNDQDKQQNQQQQDKQGKNQNSDQQKGEQGQSQNDSSEENQSQQSSNQDTQQQQTGNQQQKQDNSDSENESDKQPSRADADKSKEENKTEQNNQASANAQSREDADDKPEDQQQGMSSDRELTEEELKQAQQTEQWLRRIPDDPGGLLRRKFRYQSELDSRKAQEEPRPW